MAKILLFGEPMALFTATQYGSLEEVTQFKRSLAGAEVNVGIGLVRLGHYVTYLTCLGNDPLGHGIEKRLINELIDTSMIHYDDTYKTGMMMKNIVEVGDPEIAYYRKGSAFSQMDPAIIDTLDLNDYDQLHVTSIPCALSESCQKATIRLVERAKQNGIKISFDPNLRPALWSSTEVMIDTIHTIAQYADIILPGISEAKILMGSDNPDTIADYYLDLGIKQVIIKLGSQGAFIKTKTERFIQPGYKVEKVVDTVGAGDGFAVGIISALLEGKSLVEASNRANAIGAMQVSVMGDNEGLPTVTELNQFLNKNR